MRVLLLNDYGAPNGGSEVNTRAIRDELRRRGHDVRMLTSSVRIGAWADDVDYLCAGSAKRWQTLWQTANPAAYLALRRALREFRPDVVHVRTFLSQLSPLILPLLRHYPSIYHVVLYKPVCPMGTKWLPTGETCGERAGPACLRHRCLPVRGWLPLMLQLRLWRYWRSSFAAVVANSEAMRSVLELEGIPTSDVIWNGFAPSSCEARPGPIPAVVFAGRLVPEKGVDVLLHAFGQVAAHIKPARLLVAGDGPEQSRLRAMAEGLGLSSSVTFVGHLPQDELERRFASAWVQVIPSRWPEPFGNVAGEAMMRGTAVVASRTGGLPEFIVDGKTGCLVPPGDVGALAASLLVLVRDPALVERLGSAGRRFARAHLGIAACVDKVLDVYARVTRPALARSPVATAVGRRGDG